MSGRDRSSRRLRGLELGYWLAIELVFFAAAGLWVVFGVGRLKLYASTWLIDSEFVAPLGIPLLLLAIAVTGCLVWPRAWRLWGSVLVLALLAFAASLLITRAAFDPYAWPPTVEQVGLFVLGGEIALGIAIAASIFTFFARRSPNAVVAVWLLSGTLVAVLGWFAWAYWPGNYLMPHVF